jgi:Coenzyme PQQ synthesis protein D (PqqD)
VEVDDGVVIFSGGTNTFVDLDERGAELWLTLSGLGWDDDALVRHLVLEFDTGEDEAAEIVEAFVQDLARHGVLDVRND